jgi:hypothetical protein
MGTSFAGKGLLCWLWVAPSTKRQGGCTGPEKVTRPRPCSQKGKRIPGHMRANLLWQQATAHRIAGYTSRPWSISMRCQLSSFKLQMENAVIAQQVTGPQDPSPQTVHQQARWLAPLDRLATISFPGRDALPRSGYEVGGGWTVGRQ